MALIDTNILVYAARSQCREFATASRLVQSLTEGADIWYLTWQNVFEFIRVITGRGVDSGGPFFIDEALERAKSLLASPSLQLIHPGPRHFEIFSEIAAHTPGVRGDFVHDARLVAIMIESGIQRIYTADDGFRRFRDIEVVNPFSGGR
ncbi:PIN domain-containing protein [bacterium]|nr:PIN domain-containing protein [bacterium]